MRFISLPQKEKGSCSRTTFALFFHILIGRTHRKQTHRTGMTWTNNTIKKTYLKLTHTYCRMGQ